MELPHDSTRYKANYFTLLNNLRLLFIAFELLSTILMFGSKDLEKSLNS